MISPFHTLILACFICLNCSAKPNLTILINDQEVDEYSENFITAWTLDIQREFHSFFNTQLLSFEKVKDLYENQDDSDKETINLRIAHHTTSTRFIRSENKSSLDSNTSKLSTTDFNASKLSSTESNTSKLSSTESLTIEFTQVPIEQIDALSKSVLYRSDHRADNNEITDPNIILLQNLNVIEASQEILGSKTDFLLIIESFNVDEHSIVSKTKFFEGKNINLQASVDFTLASFATGSVIARDNVLANSSILSSLSKNSDSKSSELKILISKLAHRFASKVYIKRPNLFRYKFRTMHNFLFKFLTFLLISFTSVANTTQTIAILPPEFVNTKDIDPSVQDEFSVTLHTKILGVISKSSQFELISRKRIQDLVSEQEFSNSGFVLKKDAPKIGQLLGANQLCFIEINNFKDNQIKSSFSGTSETLTKRSININCSVNIMNAETSKIVFANVYSDFDEQIIQRDNGNFSAKSATKGSQVSSLAESMGSNIGVSILRTLRPPRIIAFQGGKVIINQGFNCALQSGDTYNVVRKSEAVKDPNSGKSLGSFEQIGEMVLTEVSEKSAFTNLSANLFKIGDYLQIKR